MNDYIAKLIARTHGKGDSKANIMLDAASVM